MTSPRAALALIVKRARKQGTLVGLAAGGACIAAGVDIVFGVGWALIVAGVGIVTLLVDVDGT